MLNLTSLQEGLMVLKVHLIYLLKINLRKEKLLVASIYNAPSQKNKYFIWYFTNLLEFYSTRHEKVILGDFNKNTENKVMKDFLREDTFYSLMKQNTCFKGDEGSCIDLLILNLKFSFMKTNSSQTGLSGHHHMMYTFLKTQFEPKKLYRNFKQVDSNHSNQFKLKNPRSVLPRKQKFYERIKNLILIRTFASK